jgi:hypothetical protein
MNGSTYQYRIMKVVDYVRSMQYLGHPKAHLTNVGNTYCHIMLNDNQVNILERNRIYVENI